MDLLIAAVAFTRDSPMAQWIPVVLYVGPDLLMPLASALAAIGGVLLMFWSRVKSLVVSAWNAVRRNKEPHA